MALTQITTFNDPGPNKVTNNPSTQAIDIANGNKVPFRNDQFIVINNTDGANALDVTITLPSNTAKGFTATIQETVATGNHVNIPPLTGEFANAGFVEITYNDLSGSSTTGTIEVTRYQNIL